MKKNICITILVLITTICFAQSFYPGVRFSPAITNGIGGTETESHKTGIGFEAGAFCGIQLNKKILFNFELDYSYKNIKYEAKNEFFGIGQSSITVPSLQVAFTLEYLFRNIINNNGILGLYGGENINFIIANQNYKDVNGTFCGNFLSPSVNIGLLLGAELMYKVGPIILGTDLRFGFDLLENELSYRGNNVKIGRQLHFLPSLNIRIPLKDK